MNDKLKAVFLKFQGLKLNEKEYILCSLIGCLSRELLLTFQVTLEPLSCNFDINHKIKATENVKLNNISEENQIEITAKNIVDNVIENSVKFLKDEYIKSKSYELYILHEDNCKISDNSFVLHTHVSRIITRTPKIHRTYKNSIFCHVDNTAMVLQTLCSKFFTEEDSKKFLTEVLYNNEYTIQYHICLCVKKRLEERWNQNCIPEKVLKRIFQNLSSHQLIKVSLVCKKWFRVSRDNSLWKDNCAQYAQEIGLKNLIEVVVEQIGEEESMINWLEIFKTLQNIFPKYKPKNDTLKNERLDFLMESLPSPSKKMRVKPKVVRLSPIKDVVDSRLSNFTSRRISRSLSQVFPNPENDRRQLMKPILGQLKRFQNTDEFAIDCKSSHLLSSVDNMKKLESKINLKWIDGALEVHTAGKSVKQKLVKKMIYFENCFRLTGHLDGVTFLKNDKLRLVSASLDSTIRIWDAVSGRSIRKMVGHKGGVYCLDFNEHILVSGGWDMTVIVWNLKPNFDVKKVFYGHKDTITAISIIDEKELIISASLDGTLRYYSVKTLDFLKVLTFQTKYVKINGILAMKVEKDNNIIATAHIDRFIRLTDINEENIQIEVGMQNDVIRTIFFQSHLLISGGRSGYLQFWEVDMNNLKCISKAQIRILTDSNLPLSIESISYYAKSIWTCHDDGTVKEWHLGTMTCLRTIIGHKGPITAICFLNNIMVTSSLDSTIRMWKITPSNSDVLRTKTFDSYRESVPLSFTFK